jgi:hypothetical protein
MNFHFIVLVELTDHASAEALNNQFHDLFDREPGINSLVFNWSWSNDLATFQVISSSPVRPKPCSEFLSAVKADMNAIGIFAHSNTGQIHLCNPVFGSDPTPTNLAFFQLSLGDNPGKMAFHLSGLFEDYGYLKFRITQSQYGLSVAYQSETMIDADFVGRVNKIASINDSSVLVGLFG